MRTLQEVDFPSQAATSVINTLAINEDNISDLKDLLYFVNELTIQEVKDLIYELYTQTGA